MPWKKILPLRSVTGFWVLGFGKKEIKFSCVCGVAVEAGGRCGLMEAGVCERERWRLCVRESDGGV